MKTLPFTPFKGSYHYAEAVHGKVKMAILSPTGVELCGPMHCKDFIQDAFLSERTKKKGSIYGFSWTPGQIKVEDPSFFLSLRYANDTLYNEAVEHLQPFLRAWEEKLGFDYTEGKEFSTVYKAEVQERTLILEYPKGWTMQPIRFGALTLLIRAATGWDGEESPLEYMRLLANGKIDKVYLSFTTDPGYVKSSLDRFEALWEKGAAGWPKQTWEQYAGDTHALHHGSGMVSYEREWTP